MIEFNYLEKRHEAALISRACHEKQVRIYMPQIDCFIYCIW